MILKHLKLGLSVVFYAKHFSLRVADVCLALMFIANRPLCGSDIEKIEADSNLQAVVDRFIDGHARIKSSHVEADKKEEADDDKKVIYEDVSLERGAFWCNMP